MSDELFQNPLESDGVPVASKQVEENTTRGFGGEFIYDGNLEICLEFDRSTKEAVLEITDNGSRFEPSFSLEADVASDAKMDKMKLEGRPGRYPLKGDFRYVAKAGELFATHIKRVGGKGDPTIWTPMAALTEGGKDRACAQGSDDKSAQSGSASVLLYWQLFSDPRVSGNILNKGESKPATGGKNAAVGYDEQNKGAASRKSEAAAGAGVAGTDTGAAAAGVQAVILDGNAGASGAGAGAAGGTTEGGTATEPGLTAEAAASAARSAAGDGSSDEDEDGGSGAKRSAKYSRDDRRKRRGDAGRGRAGSAGSSGARERGEGASDAEDEERERAQMLSSLNRMLGKRSVAAPVICAEDSAADQLWPGDAKGRRNIFQYASSVYRRALRRSHPVPYDARLTELMPGKACPPKRSDTMTVAGESFLHTIMNIAQSKRRQGLFHDGAILTNYSGLQ